MSVLQSYMQGRAARQQENQMMRQNMMQQYMQQNAQGIFKGDEGALAGLAAFDPNMALGVASTRGNMDRAARADQRQTTLFNQGQEDRTRKLTAEQAAAAAAEIEQAVERFYASGNEEAFKQWTQTEEGQQFQGMTVDQAARSLLDIADQMKLSAGGGDTEADREIARLMSIGMSRDEAIKIKEGVYKTITDPVTKETILYDLQTRSPIRAIEDGGTETPGVETSDQPVDDRLSFGADVPPLGDQFDNADKAFGIGSVFRGAANTLADTTLGVTPFPETRQAQADFKVFGEGLINAFASAYGRQPPSWLLRNIEELTPKPGSVFEGPGAAQDKLRSMARDLENRRAGFSQSLRRRMDPASRTDIEGQISGIDATLQQIYESLGEFGGTIQLAPEVEDRLKAYE